MKTPNHLPPRMLRCLALTLPMLSAAAMAQDAGLGLFQDMSAVGTLLHAGSAEYSAATGTYEVTGSGENMWANADAFQFVWTKVDAVNVTFTADISILSSGEEHRKAALMIRQSLDADSAYADVALHGNGLTSLQFRTAKSAPTHEIESNISAPHRLRIEKRGDLFYMWLSDSSGSLQFAGGSARIPITGPFYIGLAVCAHNKDAILKASFSNVELYEASARQATALGKPETTTSYSTLETINVASTDALVSYVSREPIEASSWSQDLADLVFRTGNAVMRVPAAGGAPRPASADDAALLPAPGAAPSPGHWLSPDGRMVALLIAPSSASAGSIARDWQLGVAPAPELPKTSGQGGQEYTGLSPRIIVTFAGNKHSIGLRPWSPDSRRLVFISHQSL